MGVRHRRDGAATRSRGGLDGRADSDDPTGGEIEVAAAREDGSERFSPTLAGGAQAGLYSLANAGELLLLTCRLLVLLPETEHFVDIL